MSRHFLRMLLLAVFAALLAISAPSARADAPVFTRGTLNFSLANPTSIAFGPDGRLYVASETSIRALGLSANGTQVLSTETVANGQTGTLGTAFDPSSPSPVVIFASGQNPAATDSYEGRVSTFTAPLWTRQDLVTGLPSSAPFTNHFTNGLAFDAMSRLLIAQGSNTDAGIQGPNYPETPLSAAILVADIHQLGFNGAITYSPSTPPTNDNVNQTGGNVSVYAAGTRNPFDLVAHSNGNVYATDNGPAGPTTSATCTTTANNPAQNDELNRIQEGGYYGFPNRNRGRFDVRQCTYHAPSEGSGVDFTGPLATLPAHCSCDGITEYTSGVLGSQMQGDLVIARFIFGDVVRADLSSDGTSVGAITTLAGSFNMPLDVVVGPTGIIYVAEWGAGQITYLVPQPKGVGGIAELAPPLGAGSHGNGALVGLGVVMAIGALGLAAVRVRRYMPRR